MLSVLFNDHRTLSTTCHAIVLLKESIVWSVTTVKEQDGLVGGKKLEIILANIT